MTPTERMDRLRRLLAQADNDVAAGCLAEIEGGEVVLSSQIKTDAAALHHIHQTMHERSRGTDSQGAKIVGYDRALPALAASAGEIWSDDVVGARCVYVVFSTSDGAFVGALRNPNHNLSLRKGLEILMDSLGETNGSLPPGSRFRGGVLVEEEGSAGAV